MIRVLVQAIPNHSERRAIFEHYVRTRADVERKEKRAAQKAAIEGFKHLLEEASKVFHLTMPSLVPSSMSLHLTFLTYQEGQNQTNSSSLISSQHCIIFCSV